MSSPSKITRSFPLLGTRSMRTAPAKAPSFSGESSGTPSRSAFHATPRYIAPLSRCVYPSSSATRRATVLFPEPTGPSIAIISLPIGLLSNSLERALDFLNRIAQHDGTPVRTAHRRFRFCKFRQQPLHFCLIERHVHLDRRVARGRRRNFCLQRIHGDRRVFALYAIKNFHQQPLRAPPGTSPRP